MPRGLGMLLLLKTIFAFPKKVPRFRASKSVMQRPCATRRPTDLEGAPSAALKAPASS